MVNYARCQFNVLGEADGVIAYLCKFLADGRGVAWPDISGQLHLCQKQNVPLQDSRQATQISEQALHVVSLFSIVKSSYHIGREGVRGFRGQGHPRPHSPARRKPR